MFNFRHFFKQKGTKGVISEHFGDLFCTKDAWEVQSWSPKRHPLEGPRARPDLQTDRERGLTLIREPTFCFSLTLFTWAKGLVGVFSAHWLIFQPGQVCSRSVLNMFQFMRGLVSWKLPVLQMKTISFSDSPFYFVGNLSLSCLAVCVSYFTFSTFSTIAACCAWDFSCLWIL